MYIDIEYNMLFGTNFFSISEKNVSTLYVIIYVL